MASRTATSVEQVKIDQANVILASVGLHISELKDGNGGAVIPAKGF